MSPLAAPGEGMTLRKPPAGSWVMAQTWHDLAFAHWPVAMADLRRLVPAALPVDTYDGMAWISVVPFRMSGIRLRGTPALPRLSAFPELNVRTYVTLGDKPGVYFFSLDAGNPIAVAIARRWYYLPYFHARMELKRVGETIEYQSERIHWGAPPARLVGRYRPVGPATVAAPGSLDEWLMERYSLYTIGRGGQVMRGDIHHTPWPLQPAEIELDKNTMVEALGLELARTPARAHFASRLEILAWAIRGVVR